MSLKSLISTGTKLWLDSIDPDLVARNFAAGATGATSNPIIVSDLIKTGRFDSQLKSLVAQGLDDPSIAWRLTDQLVSAAQDVFRPVYEKTNGNNGFVSFELDPLIEDPADTRPVAEKAAQYIELGEYWSQGRDNRMIKVPATPAGLAALEGLAAAGITLNVTLIFSQRQYLLARDAVWRGAKKRSNGLTRFKSVYSIFVSRVDVYTEKQIPTLSPQSQGMVGIVNAKRLFLLNRDFWMNQNLQLQQEIIFASTGTKKPADPADKYIQALAGADIQTNPPATNDAVDKLHKSYFKEVDKLPDKSILDEIDQKVDVNKMEETLMQEGIAKFADPQKALLKLIAEKRTQST